MTDGRCKARTKGRRCNYPVRPGEKYCGHHRYEGIRRTSGFLIILITAVLILAVITGMTTSISFIRSLLDDSTWLNVGIGVSMFIAGFVSSKVYNLIITKIKKYRQMPD